MSANSPLVVPILATPFGVVSVSGADVLNPLVLALIDTRAHADSLRPHDPLCYRSREDLLEWPDAPIKRLIDEMLSGVYAVLRTVNEASEAALRAYRLEARGWVTIVKPDGHVPATLYPMSSWCALYCVTAPPPSTVRPDSGVLRFYESRQSTMFSDASNSLLRLPYQPGHHGWRPVAGQMAVFPASLVHEIALLKAAQDLVLVTLKIRFVAAGQQGFSSW